MSIKNAELTDLGYAEKIVSDKDEISLTGGMGNPIEIQMRLEQLKKQKETENSPQLKLKVDRRIASLGGGIGIIRVGSKTHSEKGYLKLKFDDAVCAAQAAMAEGYVPGGGLALKKISGELPEDNLLKYVIVEPYNIIQENAGGNLKIEDWAIDPHKVIRIALENAVSVASTFIMTDGAISDDDDLANELAEDIMGRVADDWDNYALDHDMGTKGDGRVEV